MYKANRPTNKTMDIVIRALLF